MHALFYSSHEEQLRDFFRDKLDLKSTDIGDGWLIFDAPEADLGVHPIDGKEVPSEPLPFLSTATIFSKPFGNSRLVEWNSHRKLRITATAW